jgi:hypothetical protein
MLYVNPQGHCYNSARGGGRMRGGGGVGGGEALNPEKRSFYIAGGPWGIIYIYADAPLKYVYTNGLFMYLAFNLELTEHKTARECTTHFLFLFLLSVCISAYASHTWKYIYDTVKYSLYNVILEFQFLLIFGDGQL